MKKVLFTVLVLITTLVGCTNNEIEELNLGNEIGFNVLMSKSTKANYNYLTNSSDLASGYYQGFNATAISSSDESTEGTNYFSNVNWVKGNSTWTTENGERYYWPTGSYLKFYAYSPKDLDYAISKSNKTFNFQVPVAIGEQRDLVFAISDWESKASEGANKVQTVQLNFKHALTLLEVKGLNGNDDYTVSVAAYKFGNILSANDFNLSNITAPTTGKDGIDPGKNNTLPYDMWSLVNKSERKAYEVDFRDNPLVLKKNDGVQELSRGINRQILLPQVINPASISDKGIMDLETTATNWIAVLIKIVDTKTGNVIYPATNSIKTMIGTTETELVENLGSENYYAWAFIPVTSPTKVIPMTGEKGWLPGYKYIYTLDFTQGGGYGPDPIIKGIELTVNVDKWHTYDGLTSPIKM